MNNKKLSRLLEPNLKLYFLCLALFVIAAIPVSLPLALAEGAALDEAAAKKAADQEITVLKTEEPIFEAALKIYNFMRETSEGNGAGQ